jgi:predicted amidohydrolase
MDERTLAAIALSNRDFPSFEAKLREAAEWVELAARAGAALAVLPEALNLYKGDGAGNPNRPTYDEVALDHWETDCALLIETARRVKISVTIPVFRRLGDALVNCFFLVGKDGSVLGEYRKRCPTPAEMDRNVLPQRTQLIEWDGLKVGGAICFDTLFPEVFRDQAGEGADLFLVPSYWPGGSNLDFYALEYSRPILLAYPAWSRIIDIDGSEIAAGGYRWETLRFGFGSPVVLATINFDRGVFFGNINQQRIVDVQRAYGERVRVRFDQRNVLFVIESRAAELTIAEIVREFGLIERREYFRQCRDHIARFQRSRLREDQVAPARGV